VNDVVIALALHGPTEAALRGLLENRAAFFGQEARKIAAHSQSHQHFGYDKHRADQGLRQIVHERRPAALEHRVAQEL
jgi:hypothetical protein